jgi:hypothetical protein
MKKLNNLTGTDYSDEWYTDLETVNLCYDWLQPLPGSRIICPFDSEESFFVKVGIERGFKVIYGITDFLEPVAYGFDYLITNPPFSIKDRVIEKVYQYKKPALLILPIDSLSGVRRHSLYAQHGKPALYIPTRRINYYDQNWVKRNNSNFPSIFMKFNTTDTSLTWDFD